MQLCVSSMNRGAEKLGERLRKRGAKKAFADWMSSRSGCPRVDPPTVSHWLSGRRKPTNLQLAHIEDEYGIGWRTWDEIVVARKGAA